MVVVVVLGLNIEANDGRAFLATADRVEMMSGEAVLLVSNPSNDSLEASGSLPISWEADGSLLVKGEAWGSLLVSWAG